MMIHNLYKSLRLILQATIRPYLKKDKFTIKLPITQDILLRINKEFSLKSLDHIAILNQSSMEEFKRTYIHLLPTFLMPKENTMKISLENGGYVLNCLLWE